MGNSPSSPVVIALKNLLQQRKLKIDKRTLSSFLAECDHCAPWFEASGSLTVGSWEKLGQDLDREAERQKLKPGTKPIWKMIRACLSDQRCAEAVKTGQKALEEHRESLSREEKQPIAEKRKVKQKPRETRVEANGGGASLYPSLREITLRDDTEPGSDEGEESEGEGKSYGHDRYDPDPPQAKSGVILIRERN